MSPRSSLTSRRAFLGGVGAAIGARLPGRLIGEAKAAIDEPTALVIVHMVGGYNAIWASAASLVGRFGVTAGNHTKLGNGVSVDNIYASSMSAFVKTHMAVVGVRHGISNHPGVHTALWTHENQNAALALANAMGGEGSIKAAFVGENMIPRKFPGGAVNGVSFQAINDMQKTIDALGAGKPAPRTPDRAIAAPGVEAAKEMSDNALGGSPGSLATLGEGYDTATATLKKPAAKLLDVEALRTAYKLGESTTVRGFASKLAAAELMIRAGTNVVTLMDGGWDTHGNVDASRERTKMRALMPPLNTFLGRMVEDPSRNVIVFLMGDFSRSLVASGHQPNLSATVIGKYVKQGTTGRTAVGTVSLAPGTPSIPGMWSLLSALTRVDASPFGKNQHPSLVRA